MASTIANLPETLRIRTSDQEIIEVAGKLINKSLVIKELFEKNGNTIANEITIPAKFSELKNVEKAFELCDLETPHVPVAGPMENRALAQANQSVMEFFKLLPIKGMNAICNLSNIMKLTRLVDLCCAFIFSLMENKTVKEFRQLFGVRDDRTKEEEDEFKKRIEFSIDASW